MNCVWAKCTCICCALMSTAFWSRHLAADITWLRTWADWTRLLQRPSDIFFYFYCRPLSLLIISSRCKRTRPKVTRVSEFAYICIYTHPVFIFCAKPPPLFINQNLLQSSCWRFATRGIQLQPPRLHSYSLVTTTCCVSLSMSWKTLQANKTFCPESI